MKRDESETTILPTFHVPSIMGPIPVPFELLLDDATLRVGVEDLPPLAIGDLLHVRTEVTGGWTRWLGAFAIRFGTTTKKDRRPTVVNHDAMLVGIGYSAAGKVTDYVIAEALGKGGFQYRSLLLAYSDPHLYSFAVSQHRDMGREQQRLFLGAAEHLRGKPYGHLKVAAHGGDYALTQVWNAMGGPGDVYFFRRFCGMERYPMCSWAALYLFEKAGCAFMIPTRIGAPDDLWDECRALYPVIWSWPYCSPAMRRELWHPEGLGRS